jgi:hypothetical protein
MTDRLPGGERNERLTERLGGPASDALTYVSPTGALLAYATRGGRRRARQPTHTQRRVTTHRMTIVSESPRVSRAVMLLTLRPTCLGRPLITPVVGLIDSPRGSRCAT